MTIAAIATPMGEGGIGIIRISGEDSLSIAQKIFQGAKRQLQAVPANTLVYGWIKDEYEAVVDEAMAVFMRAPHSYTAENVVEIHCHGSYAALEKTLGLVLKNGARLAQPGEFTQRAFLNGRLDLAQAEAVMDIIKSRTQASLKLAMRQHRGLLSKEISKHREVLKDLVVQLEAVIDYPEEDIEDVTREQVAEQVEYVRSEIKKLLATSKTGRVLKEGLRVVITGRPNVGKSSLLNLLLQEERAIVSNIAGTTRDTIEEQLVVGGIPIVLVDTAGVRDTTDEIEKIGVQKAYDNIQSADLVLLMLDAAEGITEEDQELLIKLQTETHIVLVNKIDEVADLAPIKKQLEQIQEPVYVSVLSGAGIEEFKKRLEQIVFGSSSSNLEDNVYIQNVRHEQLLQEAYKCVDDVAIAINSGIALDCAVIDLRLAIDSLGMITGESVSDEIINEIFARFCIGK